MVNLFSQIYSKSNDYSAKDIEVLEGLEPVRRRPGMYIGGTDDRSLHHLVSEVLDNAMDEVLAGYASWIELELNADGFVIISDNGRGIPVDSHPKFPDKSALEIIMTTLHSGGKFGGDIYRVSGGLNGVGLSVVNALSSMLIVEIARNRQIWTQSYSRGIPLNQLTLSGSTQNRRGTTVSFRPDDEIFGANAKFSPSILYHLASSKAYLYSGVEIRWSCNPLMIMDGDTTPFKEVFHFPNGLNDFLGSMLDNRDLFGSKSFVGNAILADDMGYVEWAVAWPKSGDNCFYSYCNTIPTPEGGSHDLGLRNALTRGLRKYNEMFGVKHGMQIVSEDIFNCVCAIISVFIREPQFLGQIKGKLVSPEATRLIENSIKDHFDHWLSSDPKTAKAIIDRTIELAEERIKKKQAKELLRKTATRRLRLPGKLADCSCNLSAGTELFLVEGDSAGGSAKQGRNRETQAVLPLRGKILNVVAASEDKIYINQEIRNLIEALGCGIRDQYDDNKLRYEKIIIMTDADVDGAHIASLLMTFFYQEMLGLIENGHLFLACPPLYRINYGQSIIYARDDAHKEELIQSIFIGKNVEISRFKGLGEMPPHQLKETTMDPKMRKLLRVVVPQGSTDEDYQDVKKTFLLVDSLMGKNSELRFQFIKERAKFVSNIDV
ncbi:MAG: DNA topoisomerase IV subunit B [Rhodospirillaceae bacterium]|jgi:topoisomerase-4 subunit B|nr:DNA topoisomerase IV subunit B [Rhodospirillaceae bacterium]